MNTSNHTRGLKTSVESRQPLQRCFCYTLQRQNTEIWKQIFPEKEYWGLSPNFHIHASVSDLYIPTIGLPILLEEI
jgi:hypothetical protein